MAKRQPRLTKEETIARLRAIHRAHGAVSFAWIERHDGSTLQGAYQHFDSLRAARAAAGVPSPPPHAKWSRERVLDELRAAWRAGVHITLPGLRDAGHHALIAALPNHVGGIARARRLARIPDPPRPLTESEAWGSWDDDRVVAEIRALHRSGKSLAASKVSRKLISAAQRYIGSWRDAIEVAGFDYDAIRLLRVPYSKEDICDELRKLRTKSPDATFADLHEANFTAAMLKLFGSPENALAAAKIKGWPVAGQRAWTREKVLAELHTYAGPIPESLAEVARGYFGSVGAARVAAGLPRLREEWSKGLVIEKLRALAARGVYKPDKNLDAASRRYFGTLEAARAAAGTHVPKLWSREHVVEELRTMAHRGDITVAEPLLSACIRHCGSVERARTVAKIDRIIAAWSEADVRRAISHPLKDTRMRRALAGRLVAVMARRDRREAARLADLPWRELRNRYANRRLDGGAIASTTATALERAAALRRGRAAAWWAVGPREP